MALDGRFRAPLPQEAYSFFLVLRQQNSRQVSRFVCLKIKILQEVLMQSLSHPPGDKVFSLCKPEIDSLPGARLLAAHCWQGILPVPGYLLMIKYWHVFQAGFYACLAWRNIKSMNPPSFDSSPFRFASDAAVFVTAASTDDFGTDFSVCQPQLPVNGFLLR